ncbi:organic solute transporter Ostalpha-domain-containing protein [Mycena metata]|uniref:Organic solute transporter Ostalpha-domain-containing protein n=1 Tax=Mycena metata TaxID=1033252 RepID=A0AAD7KGH8_9AGAR|nr:organic solute transporter Ostalpha-domain-containing protein [Mycena metata]
MANSTCFVQSSPNSPSLLQNGNLVIQAHHVGWLIAGFFTVISVITFLLAGQQASSMKREQRYIVRLLFMVPIYATISLASYLFWNHATPLLLIRDAYESTVLTAFFYLLLTYLSPNPEDQKAIFLKVGLSRAADAEALAKGEQPRKWMFPLGFIKSKPADGLYFLQMMKWGVLQYCVIRPGTTLAAVILNYIGWYCDGSFSPRWGYVYITILVSVSVSIAMYCLIQVYLPIAPYLAPQKPILKLFAIKAVVFLTFWQSTFLAVLSMFGVIKDTTYMTADDINIGIAALLETFEMMLFAFLHLRAFSYKPYRPFHDPKSKVPPPTKTPRLRSLANVMDFRETFREIRTGWIYIMDKMRGREPTPDVGARRFAHYESAFGRPRPSNLPTSKLTENGDAEKGLLSNGEHVPRLGLPGYSNRREKSEGLEIQIERELERRGYGSHIPGRGHIGPAHEADGAPDHKPQRSWWRSVYSRVSQSGPDPEDERRLATSRPSKQRKSKSKSKSRPAGSRDFDADRRLLVEFDYEDPAPPSVLNSYRSRRQDQFRLGEEHMDTLAPLSGFDAHRSTHDVREYKQRTSSNPMFSPPIHSEGLNLMPPPIQSSSSRTPFTRSDSLLGRVFPPSAASSPSSVAHGSDSGRSSLPSASTHGVPPSRATPRGRLVLTTPQILGKVAPTFERRPTLHHPVEYATPPHQQAPAALSVDVEHDTARPSDATPQGSHSRETAVHPTPDERPVLVLDTTPVTSPLSDDFAGDSFDPPVYVAHRKCTRPNLHRRGRRQSADITAPESSYRPTSRPIQEPAGNRRMSAPLDAAPASQYSIPFYQEDALRRSGYTVENMNSDITQPSHSGTLYGAKFPTAMSPSNLGYPTGIPQPPNLSQLSYPTYAASRDPKKIGGLAGRQAENGLHGSRPARPDNDRYDIRTTDDNALMNDSLDIFSGSVPHIFISITS